MTVTLRLMHLNLDTERWAFECGHGLSSLLSTTDTAEAMGVVYEAMMAAHHRQKGCACEVPDLFEDFWVKWSDALEQWERDTAAGPPQNPKYQGQDMDVLHALTLRALREGACPKCDGAALFRTKPGEAERLTYVHARGCPDGGLKRTRVMQAGPEGRA